MTYNKQSAKFWLGFSMLRTALRLVSHCVASIAICGGLIMNATDSFAEQSRLPPCPSEYKIDKGFFSDSPDERWHNCFGKNIDPENQEYTGEWKKGLPDGQGLLKYKNSSYFLGLIKKQNPYFGIHFQEDGEILTSGYVENGRIVNQEKIDIRQFDTRLTKILMDKEWSIYFRKFSGPTIPKKEEVIPICIRSGFFYYKLIEENSAYPSIHPKSEEIKNIEGKCRAFFYANEANIKKLSVASFDCTINKFKSRCNAIALVRDTKSGEFSPYPFEKVYDLAFIREEWKLAVTELPEAEEERIQAEQKAAQLLATKEMEKKEEERKEAARREEIRKETEEKNRKLLNDPEYRKKLAEEEQENKRRLAEKDRELNKMSFTVVVACLDPYGQGMDQTLATVLIGYLLDGCSQCFSKMLNGSASKYCQHTDNKLTDLNLLRKLKKLGSLNNQNHYTVKSTTWATLGVIGR
jgi:hypothetical protein